MALLAEWSAETSGAEPGVKGFCIGLSLRAGDVSSGHFDKHQCSRDTTNNSEFLPPGDSQQSGDKIKGVQFVVQGYNHVKMYLGKKSSVAQIACGYFPIEVLLILCCKLE